MLIYDSFTSQPNKGNRTALIDAEKLSDQEMQDLARELGYAESLFYKGMELRFFSPMEEIDFCGHASLAFIWNRGLEKRRGSETILTPVGEIPIFYTYKDESLDTVWMLQASLETRKTNLERREFCEILGIEESDIDDSYPIMLASTGNWDLFVPIINAEVIDGISPDMDRLARLNRDMGVLSTHLYAMESGEDYDIYTRDFAPACGIPEDPVTGSANGALYGILVDNGVISPERELIFAQGHALGLKGRVHGIMDKKTGRILVGGRAVQVE
ncbi:MAG: PhzF family phenazine biosynthesis protein [Tissierellia bacterium]|nr:PhzF family phenazine biosynthesis protein [Tissierellia bacterium]